VPTEADEQILFLLGRNDEQALELMFREHYSFLCQAVVRIVQDPHTAEDLVQDVFLELWRKRQSLCINLSLKAYLRRAAINKTLNHLRSRRIQWEQEEAMADLQVSQESMAAQMDGMQLEKAVEHAIGQLPERCRLVFTLSRFEELSNAEIAARLEISVKTVENQMTKALRVLRSALGPYLEMKDE
jgi:RNA polymerase sigma-70 factor (ECF subfamily)